MDGDTVLNPAVNLQTRRSLFSSSSTDHCPLITDHFLMEHQLQILDAAAAWEISDTSLRLMLLLALGQHKRPSDMARSMTMTPAGVGCALKPLLKRRIVRKRRHTQGTDERGVTFELLPYGKRILEQILQGNKEATPSSSSSDHCSLLTSSTLQ